MEVAQGIRRLALVHPSWCWILVSSFCLLFCLASSLHLLFGSGVATCVLNGHRPPNWISSEYRYCKRSKPGALCQEAFIISRMMDRPALHVASSMSSRSIRFLTTATPPATASPSIGIHNKSTRGSSSALPSHHISPAVTHSDAVEKVTSYLENFKGKTKIPDSYIDIFSGFVKTYAAECAKSGQMSDEEFVDVTTGFIKVAQDCTEFPFEPFHKAVREPIDFYGLGNRFWRPLIDMNRSKLVGKENLELIRSTLTKGSNVIMFSNHQIEPDPQVMRLVFEHLGYKDLGQNLIMVAGHRVRTDPLSIPFSMGCNLLCVHSKKHMVTVPSKRAQKQAENLETMRAMQVLLNEGGRLIWVAPSGGRDRKANEGQFEVSDFDPKTVQMFTVLAKKAESPTAFFPMALSTAAICPPPPEVESAVGEARSCAFSPVGMAIGRKLPREMSNGAQLSGLEFAKEAQRQTEKLYEMVKIV